MLLIALLCGVVAGGSYLLKIRAPELPSKDDGSKNNNTEQTDGIDYGDGVRPKAGGERKSKDFYTVLISRPRHGRRRQHRHDAAREL